MIRVTNQWGSSASDDMLTAHHYTIAGERLVFQQKLDVLSAYDQGAASDSYSEMLRARRKREFELLGADNARLQYKGVAQFNNADRKVHYWRKNEFAQVDVDGEPICHIDFKEDHIHVLNDRPIDDRLNLEVVTGPALVVLLAVRHIYCLHAGAVSTEVGNIAMISESGSGKSTLSSHLDQSWAQISDDILPLRCDFEDSDVEMLSDFPQLKLDGASVQEINTESSVVDFILRIDPEPSDKIEFKVMPRTDALLQLVRHTVGAKLFGSYEMLANSKFAKRVTMKVPVIELSYPRDISQLHALRAEIISYLRDFKEVK